MSLVCLHQALRVEEEGGRHPRFLNQGHHANWWNSSNWDEIVSNPDEIVSNPDEIVSKPDEIVSNPDEIQYLEFCFFFL